MDQETKAIEDILDGANSLPDRIAVTRAWLDENLRNDPKTSRSLIERLMPELRAAKDAQGVAWLQFFQGWLDIDADDYEPGLKIMETAKSTFEDLGDREGFSRCLNAMGFIHFTLGTYDLALDCFRESMSEGEKVGRRDLCGTASMNMAECLYTLEEPNEALQIIEHCRKEYTTAPHNLAATHSQAGLIYRALGRLEEAEHELLDAIQTSGSSVHDCLEAKQILADVHLDAERYDEAEKLVDAGLVECHVVGERMLGTRFRLSRARLALFRNRNSEAIGDAEAAIAAAREIGAHKIEVDAEKMLYQAWQACGEYQKALAAFVRHSRLKDTMKSEQTSRRILGLHDDRARREARHFEKLYKQISAISEIGQRITANLDLDVTLETLYEAVNGLMDAPTLMIALVDEERACLDYRLVMIRGVRQEPFSCALSEETFGCWCVNHRQDILIGDLDTEYHRYVPSFKELVIDGNPDKSLVFVPLIVGDKVAGMFTVQSHLTNAYDKKQVETIRAIGGYIGIAIENTRLFRQIQRLATLDCLTGLLNRRRFTEALEEAYLKTRRYKTANGIIMIDVDHFKEVNDKRGHDVGDEVLRALARIFTEKVRGCDFVGRFGGEEFVILLPETNLDGAIILAERLREAVEGWSFQAQSGDGFHVTASFGIAVIRPADPSHESVLKRADKALYHAKSTGRNRVCLEEVL
jgi:diguanylate cyclase (GGDEF)-like protein